jgi:hypothetical protein
VIRAAGPFPKGSGTGHLEIIVLGDVGDADDEDAHPAAGAVDDAGRDMDDGAFADGMLLAVEEDDPAALQDVRG